MNRAMRALWALASIAMLVLVMVACGDESDSGEEETTTAIGETTTTTGSAGVGATGLVLEVMAGDPRLSLAHDAYMQNGYDLELQVAPLPNVAVLAPGDAAFEAWLEAEELTYEEFLETDPEGAFEILGGQLIPGGLEGASGEVELPTLSEDIWVSLTVDDDGGLTLTDYPEAEVIDRIEADNGVIFVLDTFVVSGGSNNSGADGRDASGGGLEPDMPTQGQAVLAEEFDLPLSITTEDEWFAAVVQPGAVILEYPERSTPFTRAVLMLTAEPIGAETVDDWAEQQDAVTLEDRRETQVSGFDTVVYDLTYDGQREQPFLSAQCCGGRIILRNTEYYRVWVIDIDAEKPLVVFSPVLRGDLDWYEKVQDVVDSMEIG